jgi:hypothetical protein
MRPYTIISICLLLVLLAGCTEDVQKSQDTHSLNSRLIESYGNTSIDNAIISQHTLFSYHFVNNSAELNELGRKDLDVLIKHFKENPGELNIRQGEASNRIYQARVDLVLKKMQEAGVDRSKITVSDGMPGGSGMPSEEVLSVLKDEGKTDK